MIKKVIKIDENKCVGCGLCATACKEGAIGMMDGKAKLMREDYCDGLGNCLPVCPTSAITFEEREIEIQATLDLGRGAGANQNLADANQSSESANQSSAGSNQSTSGSSKPTTAVPPLACGCPGTLAKTIVRKEGVHESGEALGNQWSASPSELPKGSPELQRATPGMFDMTILDSQLRQWPCQIKLVPVNAPYFEKANLLISADCAAYAFGDFHRKFMKNKITLIGCPKLDEGDYTEKLTAIIKNNNLKSITVVRMEVPCCGGLENAAKQAIMASGKMIPWSVVTIGTDGEILED